MSRLNSFQAFKNDGTTICPRIQCDIDCKGLEDGCRYAHPPKGSNRTICKFYFTGCNDINCNRIHMRLINSYKQGFFTPYKGAKKLVDKEQYFNILSKIKKYNELMKNYKSVRDSVDDYLLKINLLESKINSLESKIESLNGDVELKDEKIEILEELQKNNQNSENNEDNEDNENHENNQSSKKRKLEVESEEDNNHLYKKSYNDFYQNEIKYKNDIIIDLNCKLNKILMDNKFMAERLGWEPSEL